MYSSWAATLLCGSCPTYDGSPIHFPHVLACFPLQVLSLGMIMMSNAAFRKYMLAFESKKCFSGPIMQLLIFEVSMRLDGAWVCKRQQAPDTSWIRKI